MIRWDTLFVGGRIRSLEREGEVFSAMAVSGGKVAALFAEEPPPAAAARARTVVDLGGRTVLPGLIDGHMHFLPSAALGEAAMTVADIGPDGPGAQTLASIRGKLRAYAAKVPAGRPLFCHTYLIDAVEEKRLPDRGELDAWVPGRAVIVLSMDGHSSSFSTRALEMLGLLSLCPGGVLTGSGHELSMGKVNTLLARSVTPWMLAHGIQRVVNDALAQGLVCLHCMDGFEDSGSDPALWVLSRCGGTLPIDLRLFIQYRDPARLAPYRRFLRDARIGGCFGWAMDGSISSGTAALDEPYVSDPANSGKLYFTAPEAAALVERAARAGFQVTAHAIGTRAIEVLLSAYESLPPELAARRHRIDHFELPTRDQVERALRLGLSFTVQPGFTWLDERFVFCYRRQLSPRQYARQVPLRRMAEAGGIIVGSSDCPAGPLSPWLQMQGMVQYPLAAESLSLYQALRTYTWNAAWSTGEERERGTLAAGKKADFIVMEEDPFSMPLTEIHRAAVRETWIDGRITRPLRMPAAAFFGKALLGRRKKI